MITELLLVRHGESTANVAATAAEAAGSETIDVAERDADVPLSEKGVEQARALGSWVGDLGPGARTVFWSSPYLRARQTIGTALDEAGVAVTVQVDERLRDRELGVLDLLTRRGVQALHPDEEARRRRLGKYYHRPPGGESWADVALRVRSLLRDLEQLPDADRVVVAAHDAVIMLVVAVCTDLGEAELLEFASGNTVTNASVTTLRRAEGASWALARFADVAHLAEEDAPVTAHEGDRDVRPR